MSRLDPDVVCIDATIGSGMTLLTPREVPLGGVRALTVRRTLPHSQIRRIGAWCFVDHFGPASVADHGMHVPSHPHIGLQTVTWLYSGEVLHRDSLGSVQRIRPGELNLMTAGRGIAHAEDSVLAGKADAAAAATMHGLQLWVALPDADRHQAPHFEHHAGLPSREFEAITATVVLGGLGRAGALGELGQLGPAGVSAPTAALDPPRAPDAVRWPAATYSPIVGADLELHRPGVATELPLESTFEHGVLAVEGGLLVDGEVVPRGSLRYLPPGRRALTIEAVGSATDGAPDGAPDEARVRAPDGVTSAVAARAFLLGGTPFDEPLVMWWNFVGRNHDEIAAARADWEADRAGTGGGPSGASGHRFAPVAHPAAALPAPGLPTTRLLAR